MGAIISATLLVLTIVNVAVLLVHLKRMTAIPAPITVIAGIVLPAVLANVGPASTAALDIAAALALFVLTLSNVLTMGKAVEATETERAAAH